MGFPAPDTGTTRTTKATALATQRSRWNANLNAIGDSSNSAIAYVLPYDAAGFRVVYANPLANTSDLVVTAGFEQTVGGTSRRITFRGATSITLAPGALTISDLIPYGALAGATVRVSQHASSSSGKIPLGPVVLAAGSDKFEYGNTLADYSMAPASMGLVAPSAAFGPVAVLAETISGRQAIGALGDSIADGYGDTNNQGKGYIVRACETAGVPVLSMGYFGQRLQDYMSQTAGNRADRGPLYQFVTHIVEEFGINDVAGSIAEATIKADKLKLWRELASAGLKTFTCTLTPISTSTDSWATTANQTTHATNSVRVNINNWIRAGAPIDASTLAPVAIGTSGALVAGQTGHPLSGYFEVADTVESARDSGKWKVDGTANKYTADGTHPTTAGYVLAQAAITVATVLAV